VPNTEIGLAQVTDRPRPNLIAAASDRLLVMDAGMGTRLLAMGLCLKSDDPALWNIAHPAAVASVHALDVAAGSTVLTTNTFGANRSWLQRYGRGDDLARINHLGVSIAQSSGRGQGGLVVGSIGPTALDQPGALQEQAELLESAGVDALLLETFRGDQAVAALQQLAPLPSRRPVLVSLYEWPAPAPALAAIEDLARRLEDLGASVLGVNCVPGMKAALRVIERLARVTQLPLLVKPASLAGEAVESFGAAVPELLALGVRLIGGCCGTDERHVAAIHAACYDSTGESREQPGSEWL
jgi:5-methyltetrahydrofolate--homocysteine methyltransferase